MQLPRFQMPAAGSFVFVTIVPRSGTTQLTCTTISSQQVIHPPVYGTSPLSSICATISISRTSPATLTHCHAEFWRAPHALRLHTQHSSAAVADVCRSGDTHFDRRHRGAWKPVHDNHTTGSLTARMRAHFTHHNHLQLFLATSANTCSARLASSQTPGWRRTPQTAAAAAHSKRLCSHRTHLPPEWLGQCQTPAAPHQQQPPCLHAWLGQWTECSRCA